MTVELQEGSQDVIVTSPDGKFELKDRPVEPSTESYTIPIQPADCEE